MYRDTTIIEFAMIPIIGKRAVIDTPAHGILILIAECVWKVAKYTSAAPVYFEPEDCGQHRYIDGGIKANNPTDYALTKIQTHLDEQSAAMQSVNQ
jgi:predicted acylesterase/phospholipase RssA